MRKFLFTYFMFDKVDLIEHACDRIMFLIAIAPHNNWLIQHIYEHNTCAMCSLVSFYNYEKTEKSAVKNW